jgi:hypothetical protein
VVAGGTGYAGVDFGGGTAWDQGSFTIYTNGNYSRLEPRAQMTVLIHELLHVSLGHTEASKAIDTYGVFPGAQLSYVTISKNCGTVVPAMNQ